MVDRVLTRLNQLNRTAVFLVTALVVVVALVVGGWPAAAVLFLLAGGVAVLLARSWGVSAARHQILRLVMLALLIMLAILSLSR